MSISPRWRLPETINVTHTSSLESQLDPSTEAQPWALQLLEPPIVEVIS